MKRNDKGFTLIEILVSVSILGIVMVVLSQSIVLGFQTYIKTETMLTNSRGKQLMASYFTRDVQNTSTADTTTASCVVTTGVGGQTIVVNMTGTDFNGVAVNYVYARDSVANTLYRHVCTGAADESQLIAGDVSSSSAACYSTTYTAGPCDTAPVVRVTITTSAGTYSIDGRRRQ